MAGVACDAGGCDAWRCDAWRAWVGWAVIAAEACDPSDGGGGGAAAAALKSSARVFDAIRRRLLLHCRGSASMRHVGDVGGAVDEWMWYGEGW